MSDGAKFMNFLKKNGLLSLLSNLRMGTNIRFATFSLCVGDYPGGNGHFINIFQHHNPASVLLCVELDKYTLYSSCGEWGDFDSGQQLHTMLSCCLEMKATEEPSTDELIPQLVKLIGTMNTNRQIEQEMRYGIDSLCRVRLSDEGENQNVNFALIKQSPGEEALTREVDFLIQHTISGATGRLIVPRLHRHFATREQVPFLTGPEQAELLGTLSLRR
jgi:hypothetical protein